MLANLLRRLAGPSIDDRPLDREDARIAVAGLLVAAANADHAYEAAERIQIEKVLAARYGLDAAGATRLREEGEQAEAAATDMFRFTSMIKASVPHEERASVLEALWRVVLADGYREMHEDTLMRRVTDLLGLDNHDSARARQRVESGA
jgi:uncharacterized tellurite resistance protein B-like protein